METRKHVWRANVKGTRNMLDAVKRSGSKTICLHKYLLRSDGLSGSPLPNIDERWPALRTPYSTVNLGVESLLLSCPTSVASLSGVLMVLRIDC
jgi:hypothetical protein